jgi:hypothetical protein
MDLGLLGTVLLEVRLRNPYAEPAEKTLKGW